MSDDIESIRSRLDEACRDLEVANARFRKILAERSEIEERLIRSEAAARELLETAAQGVIAVDARGRIVRANELACSMYGYSLEEMLKLRLGALVPKGLGRAHSQHMEGFFRQPSRRPMGAGRDLMGRRKDGRVFPVEVGLSSVETGNGRWAVAFISDITERKRVETELRQQQQQLRELHARLVAASEESNRRWARELHDVYSQRLVALAMQASELAAKGGLESDALESIGGEIRRLAQDIHRLSRQMHPAIVHDLGLAVALKQELGALEAESEIATVFETRGVPPDLPEEIAIAFYRIAQEAIRNIRSHAQANRVRIELDAKGDALRMLIEDEGDGFELERAARRGGLGLVSMEERARAVGGSFSIESQPGKGTRLSVTVPVK